MRLSVFGVATVVSGLASVTAPLCAQGYHVRLDTRLQSVSYRGWELRQVSADSVLLSGDGTTTYQGFAVRCPVGAALCTYYAAGVERDGAPLVSTLDAALWGFGVRGLTFRTKARVGTDLNDPAVWPGLEPEAQLLEAYAQYAGRSFTLQAGRTHVYSRLGFVGLDGGKLDVRPLGGALRLTAYGGWGLARSAALPVTSAGVNPFGDESFFPEDRQLIAGGSVGWSFRGVEGRLLYQREVDPRGDLESVLAGERGAVDLAYRPVTGLTITGGAAYDFARGEFGTVDGRVTYTERRGRYQLSVGERYYRPYFDLWTIWGVFSPTPYTATFGSARVSPIAGLELWTRGEAYSYDDTGADTLLVRAEDNGVRWSIGATLARYRGWTLELGYHVEDGVGANALGFDGRLWAQPLPRLSVSAYGSYLSRPLEYRFNDVWLMTLGLRADYEPMPGVSVHAAAVRYDETRQRDDAAQFDWDQIRLQVGLTLEFGVADRPQLHPAILRIPERRAP